MNLFLQLKVSDGNDSEIESIDLSSFETQFLSRCYKTQVEIWKNVSQLYSASNPIYKMTKKINTLQDMLS